MLIKVEPAGFFMYTVQMVFDVEQPDSEDLAIRDYLAEYELEPRYKWNSEDEGRNCQWLQFGGCYLGKHLQGIGQIQRKAVEVELLTEEVNRCLESGSIGTRFSSEEQRQSIVSALVQEFQRESTFQVNENGELAAVLDYVEVEESWQRLLSG